MGLPKFAYPRRDQNERTAKLRAAISCVSIAVFVANLLAVVVSRTLYVLTVDGPTYSFLMPIDVRYEEICVIFLRGLPESVRVLCSGYISVIMLEFVVGPMEQTRLCLM